MDIRRLESLLFQEHVVKAGQDHTGYGNNGPLMSAAFLNAIIFDPEIRVLLVLDGSKGTLDQQGLKVGTDPGDPAAFLLTGALIILRGKTGPGAEMFSGFEYCHICPNLSNDITGGGLCDAGNVRGQLDQVIIGAGEFYDGIVQPANDRIKIVCMLTAELYLESLVIGDLVADNGSNDIIRLILSPFEEELFTVFRIKILTG